MTTLSPDFDIELWFDRLAGQERPVLMLDYDGTLAPFQVQRDRATPYEGVRPLLNEIIEADRTRLVVVSGRPVSDLESLLGLNHTPEIWGSHGAEHRRLDGSLESLEQNELVTLGTEEIAMWARDQAIEDAMERKPTAVAFHWRGHDASDAESLRRRIVEAWGDTAPGFGLKLCDFDGGIEARAAAVTKGGVVDRILAESPQEAMVAYLGDDTTDEDAFEALGSRGLSALVRSERRPTAASLWLEPPDELLSFMKRWHEATRDQLE